MALSKFHASVKETVRTACENALLKEGFVHDPIEEPQPDGQQWMIHINV